MLKINNIFDLEEYKTQNKHSVLGLVMTMGSLHSGHQALITRAKQCCDKVMVSIYVNPLQFGPNEDFDKYPRPLENDLKKCEDWNVDAVLLPDDAMLYPEGKKEAFQVCPPESISQVYHGTKRPQFFNGVATVVLKLLQLVRPQVTVFGHKDAQQFCVVSQLIKTFYVPTTLLGIPTVREESGLAISSRNQYLSQQDMAEAQYLSQLLLLTQQRLVKEKKADVKTVLKDCINNFQKLTSENSKISLEYLSCIEIPTVTETTEIGENSVLIGEMMLGNLRLIDCLEINETAPYTLQPQFQTFLNGSATEPVKV